MAEQFLLPKALFLAALLGARTVPASSQALEDIKTPKELHAVIAALDAELFDTFNRCESATTINRSKTEQPFPSLLHAPNRPPA